MKLQPVVGTVKRILQNEQTGEIVLKVVSIKRRLSAESPKIQGLLTDGQDNIVSIFKRNAFSLIDAEKIGINSVIKTEAYSLRTHKEVTYIMIEDFSSWDSQEEPLKENRQEKVMNAEPPKIAEPERRNSLETIQNTGSHSLPASICPLNQVAQYKKDICIRVRAISRAMTKTWINDKGEGRLFYIYLRDETEDIKLTGFGDQVDLFAHVFTPGSVYVISNILVKQANQNYRDCLGNDKELYITSKTNISLYEQGCDGIPQIGFSFTPIAELKDADILKKIDVMGVITQVGPLETIAIKSTKREMAKRNVKLIDDSKTCIWVSLWGNDADFISEKNNEDVLAIKDCYLNEYRGRSLSIKKETFMYLNLETKEARSLYEWYSTVGKTIPYSVIGEEQGMLKRAGSFPFKTVCDIQEEEGQFQTRCMLQLFKHEGTISYISCPEDNCFKKVTKEDDGYYCPKCDKKTASCIYRYTLQTKFSDFTGSFYLTLFNDQAEELIGMNAEALEDIRNRSPEEYLTILAQHLYKDVLLGISCRKENYMDELRWKGTINTLVPIDYHAQTLQILEEDLS